MKLKMMFKQIKNGMTRKSMASLLSLACVISLYTTRGCLFFLGEGKKGNDVNEESARELKAYMKDIRKRSK